MLPEPILISYLFFLKKNDKWEKCSLSLDKLRNKQFAASAPDGTGLTGSMSAWMNPPIICWKVFVSGLMLFNLLSVPGMEIYLSKLFIQSWEDS